MIPSVAPGLSAEPGSEKCTFVFDDCKVELTFRYPRQTASNRDVIMFRLRRLNLTRSAPY